MRKIGITGRSGFIGWHLSSRILLNNNFKIIDFQKFFFDDENKLDEFVKCCDIIIHLAGVNRHNDDDYILKTNISLSEKLVQSFIRTNFSGKLIFSSSIHEDKNSSFGISKRESTKIFLKWSQNYDGQFINLIIPNVFGPFGVPFYNSVISTFCYQLNNNISPEIINDSKLKLIYIDDLVDVILNYVSNVNKKNINDLIGHTNSFKVSTLLNYLIEFKNQYIENAMIPNLDNKFKQNLFNTFASYINLSDFYPRKYLNNSDERGNFVEIMKLHSGGQVSFSSTKPKIIRGNHFHTRKIERFSIIKGKALVQLRKFGSNEIYEFKFSGDKPSFIDMPIWFTHNIKNIGKEDLLTVFWINEFYDSKNPDTFYEIV